MAFPKKIITMALLGAIGAAAGALAAETLFRGAGRAVQPTEPRTICLLFDVSGSMAEVIRGAPTDLQSPRLRTRPSLVPKGGEVTQIMELQRAAGDFVRRQDLTLDTIGLVVFSTGARVAADLSHDPERLQRAIRRLEAGGTTDLGRGLDVARRALRRSIGERWIILFSDGKPQSSSTREGPGAAALSAAARVRAAGIQIVAIGTGLADKRLLARIAGTPGNVIISDRDRLNDAFKRSEAVINRQMLASQPASSEDFVENLVRTGLWASLIAIGAALGLAVGQNRHLRRRPLSIRGLVIILLGGVVTGALAGAPGQALYYHLSSMPMVGEMGRLAAWWLLGCGVGFGMSFFVPNLNRKRAMAGGAVGGILAAVCFVAVVPSVGDPAGRLLAAAILGLSTGMMTVIVEAVARKAWLIVHWSKTEKSTMLLGPRPIIVGNSSRAHILLPPDTEGDQAKITFTKGEIKLWDKRSGRSRKLTDGETWLFGQLRIEVRVAHAGSSDSGPSSSAAPDEPEAAEPEPAQPAAPAPAAAARAASPALVPPAPAATAAPAAPAAPHPPKKKAAKPPKAAKPAKAPAASSAPPASSGGPKWYEADGISDL